MSFSRRLLNLMSVKDGSSWMLTPNPKLGGISPDKAIRNGEYLKVNTLLDEMEQEKRKKLQ